MNVFQEIRAGRLPVPETPCLVVDESLARENIARVQQGVNAAGCQLRPHIKTHKMPYFARLQLEAGAAGITCAKVSEAEVMAAGGAEDIFRQNLYHWFGLRIWSPGPLLAIPLLVGAACLPAAALAWCRKRSR